MSHYLFCHRRDQKLDHRVCEQKCRRVDHCKDYEKWDYKQFMEVVDLVEEKQRELEDLHGVIRIEE